MSVFHIRCSLALVLLPLAAAAGSGRHTDAELLTARVVGLSDSAQAQVENRYKASVDTSRFARNENLALFYRVGKTWSEVVDVAVLKRVFPDTRFYSVMAFTFWPAVRYLMAEYRSNFYRLPESYNQLLADHGIVVTDANIVECAKAFIASQLVALIPADSVPKKGAGFLEAEVLAATRGRIRVRSTSYGLSVQLRVGEQNERWLFEVFRGAFGAVVRYGPRGFLRDYTLGLQRWRGNEGKDLGESMRIDTMPPFCATVEHDSASSYYYVVVEKGGSPTLGILGILGNSGDVTRIPCIMFGHMPVS